MTKTRVPLRAKRLIATAIVAEPDVVILDEPTSGVAQ